MALLILCFLSVSASTVQAAERGNRSRVSGPQQQADSRVTSFNPYPHNSLQWSLFNATASFLGLPGLASPYTIGADGLADEGLGFHADGTTRRAGEGNGAAGGFSGQRAASYVRSGMNFQTHAWLYDDILGIQRDSQGRILPPGSQYSGIRRNSYGQALNPGDNIFNSVMQRGISAGMGFANSAVESSILGLMGNGSPYGNGKARLNFMWYLDENGKSRFGGEGDVLWPLYDSLYTTVYTQFGARSMFSGGDDYGPDRWIGNIGVGQRWFPAASFKDDGKTVDSGNWMFGYNAFFDYDITRGHQRGGVGVEAQYDWLKVATNYYAPLSGWKDSKDFDGSFVEERAAQGWDLRVKGYLPFYREVAVTGAYSQWYGDHVGMFGPSKLEKDPKIWSYGLEYTPVPAMTAFVNQRQTERGRADTEFGLRFTYHFGMDAESQFKPSRVAEMRTVHGARHDFVDRENKIILEYRTKNRFRIDFAGFDGANTFTFRVRDGFDKPAVGQLVRVMAGGTVTIASAPPPVQNKTFVAQVLEKVNALLSVRAAHADSGMSYTTDRNGIIRVRVNDPGKLDFLSASAGETTAHFTRQSLGLGPKVESTIKSDDTEVNSNGSTIVRITNAAPNTAVEWKVEGVASAAVSAKSRNVPDTVNADAGDGIISGDRQTNAKGEASATFTATKSGGVRIIAKVGSQVIACDLAVKAIGVYAIEATPTALIQGTPAIVTFTVKKDGHTVPASTSVTFTANNNFTNLPTEAQNTSASGQIIVANLTATATGSQTVSATVGGKTASVAFNVTAPTYTLEATPTALTQGTATSVTFTVKQHGTAVPVNTPVTFTTNSNFTNLPPGAQKTNASGQITVATLTAKTTGTQRVSATVDGQTVSVDFTVTAAASYTLDADPKALTKDIASSVTFTVKKDGAAVPVNTPVTFTSNSNFANLPPGAQNTNASGQITVATLTAKTAGTQTVSATVDGKTVSVDFTVSAGGSYTFDLSALTLDASGNLGGTILVQQGGSPTNNVAVTLSYATAGGTGSATSTDISLGNTGSDGKVTASGNVSALVRKVAFIAKAGGNSSATKELTVGTVPSGFLTGKSLSYMNNSAAQTYCASHGGKLPRVNNSNSASVTDIMLSGPTSVDGFGTSAWPAGLPGDPGDPYWTSTTVTEIPDYNFYIENDSGVTVDSGDGNAFAACVP